MSGIHSSSNGDLKTGVYRAGLAERVQNQLQNSSLPIEVRAFLNSIASEEVAKRLLVIDDEHNLFDANGTWIPKTTALVRQLLSADLIRMEDDKLICSTALVKLIRVRSMIETAKQQLQAAQEFVGKDHLVAKLLELSCNSSDFREGSSMMSLCIAPAE